MKILEIIEKLNFVFEYNDRDNSYFTVVGNERNYPIHLRISDYGTNISTWVDENNKVSNKPINICFVLNDGSHPRVNSCAEMVVKDNMNHIVGIVEEFEILLFHRNIKDMDEKNINELIDEINNIENNIENLKKKTHFFRLKPNHFLQIR